MLENDVSDVDLGKVVRASKQAIGLLLNPAPVGRKPVGTSSLARPIANHTGIPLPISGQPEDLADWIESGRFLKKHAPQVFERMQEDVDKTVAAAKKVEFAKQELLATVHSIRPPKH